MAGNEICNVCRKYYANTRGINGRHLCTPQAGGAFYSASFGELEFPDIQPYIKVDNCTIERFKELQKTAEGMYGIMDSVMRFGLGSEPQPVAMRQAMNRYERFVKDESDRIDALDPSDDVPTFYRAHKHYREEIDNLMQEGNELRTSEASLLNDQTRLNSRIKELETELKSITESRDVLVEKATSSNKKLIIAERMYRCAASFIGFGIRPTDGKSYHDSYHSLRAAARQWEKINDCAETPGDNDEFAVGDTEIRIDPVMFTDKQKEKIKEIVTNEISRVIGGANREVAQKSIESYINMETPEWHYLIDGNILTGKQVEVIRDMIKDEIARAFDVRT